MGYRSNVKCYLSKNAYDEMKKEFKEKDMDLDKEFHFYQDKEGNKLLDEEAIKWYESFVEVELFMHTLRKLDDLNTETGGTYGYTFIRSGEDTGDIETHESGDGPYSYAETIITIEGEENFE